MMLRHFDFPFFGTFTEGFFFVVDVLTSRIFKQKMDELAKTQQRSKMLAASPKKFTEESNRLSARRRARLFHAGSRSLELPCLLDSLRGRRRMTEPSHAENLSHPVISKDMLHLHQS